MASDTPQALAAQILSAYCQSGKVQAFAGDIDGSATGKHLAGIYTELLAAITPRAHVQSDLQHATNEELEELRRIHDRIRDRGWKA
jgi:hypothetical protein